MLTKPNPFKNQANDWNTPMFSWKKTAATSLFSSCPAMAPSNPTAAHDLENFQWMTDFHSDPTDSTSWKKIVQKKSYEKKKKKKHFGVPYVLDHLGMYVCR